MSIKRPVFATMTIMSFVVLGLVYGPPGHRPVP
jgi:hypothetical protein